MEDLVRDYIEKHEVTFELRAVDGDGETLVRFTGNSFDDVTGYASLADQTLEKLVQEDEEDRLELERQRQEDLMEDTRDY